MEIVECFKWCKRKVEMVSDKRQGTENPGYTREGHNSLKILLVNQFQWNSGNLIVLPNEKIN